MRALTSRARPLLPPPDPPSQDWATPTERSTVITGVSGLTVVSNADTMYVDCPNLTIANGASHFTVVSDADDLPTINRGWHDFWIGGHDPTRMMNAGPRHDGGDLHQIKAPSGGLPVPENGIYAFIDFHDVSRINGPTGHPDAVQMMYGLNLIFGGCAFRNLASAVQGWFLKTEGPSAGGGPIENCVLDGSTFSNITGKAVNVSGNSTPGGYPGIRIINNNFGGRDITVDQATIDAPGFEFSGNINGDLIPVS